MSRHRKDIATDTMRRCHDCGKPTRDYRCAACREAHLERWRKEQGISLWEFKNACEQESYSVNLYEEENT